MKIDIISGFLGAGKTTLIKKLLLEAYPNEKKVIIENEFGEIGIDGGFLQETGVQITEMNSGCICCSLVGDFAKALKEVAEQFNPDRIIVEPSGVGKLSDVINAVKSGLPDVEINTKTTVINAKKCAVYAKNFGEFFLDQLQHASCVILSHTDEASQKKIDECVAFVKENNPNCTIVSTHISQLSGEQVLEAMENTNTISDMANELLSSVEHHHHHHHEHGEECCCGHEHGHHEHHHEHGEECCCGHGHGHHEHHHEHGEECCCGHEHGHHEHHHEHGEECCCGHEHGHHEHHHEHGEECCCGHEHEHEHHHHHHEHGEECCCGHHHGHHADEVFTAWGKETAIKYSESEILDILNSFEEQGNILRAKGIVDGVDGWIHFDFIPGNVDVRKGSGAVIGKICVIGSELDEEKLAEIFRI